MKNQTFIFFVVVSARLGQSEQTRGEPAGGRRCGLRRGAQPARTRRHARLRQNRLNAALQDNSNNSNNRLESGSARSCFFVSLSLLPSFELCSFFPVPVSSSSAAATTPAPVDYYDDFFSQFISILFPLPHTSFLSPNVSGHVSVQYNT